MGGPALTCLLKKQTCQSGPTHPQPTCQSLTFRRSKFHNVSSSASFSWRLQMPTQPYGTIICPPFRKRSFLSAVVSACVDRQKDERFAPSDAPMEPTGDEAMSRPTAESSAEFLNQQQSVRSSSSGPLFARSPMQHTRGTPSKSSRFHGRNTVTKLCLKTWCHHQSISILLEQHFCRCSSYVGT